MDRQLPFDAFDIDPETVRARFDWAVRNGNPVWLWPEISTQRWQQTLARIEAVSRAVLTEGRAVEPLTGCARTFGVAGYTSGMGPLLRHWLSEGAVEAEPEVAAVLALHLQHNTARMARMARRAVVAVEALAAGGVPVLVLKGMQTAFAHFPIPGARPLSDIDLAIGPDDRARAGEILGGMGLVAGPYADGPPAQQAWSVAGAGTEPRSLELVHADDPWSIDLQTSLNRRYSRSSPVVRLDALWAAAAMQPWALSPGGAVLVPAAQALHLACHAVCGLGNLSLVRLCELALVIRERGFDWHQFAALAERSGALPTAYPALHLTEMLVPGTVPGRILARGRAAAPAAVLRVVDRLTPASAQRILQWSLEERFMWTRSPWPVLREIAGELAGAATSLRTTAALQRRRAFRLLRGRLSWRFESSC